MAVCIQCSSLIVDEQHYFMRDMDQDIVDAIEQHIGYEVLNLDSEICSQCLAEATRTLARELMPETNVCVWCRSSLFQRRSHAIPQGHIRNFIVERIYPRQIPPSGLTCNACWTSLNRMVVPNEIVENVQPPQNLSNHCVRCLYSLSRRRRHSLPEGHVRDEISARIAPRQIPEGGLVCYSCWSAARQHVQRRERREIAKQADSFRRHYANVCGWCQTSLFRQRTHLLPPGAERDFVLGQVHPREIPNHNLLCLDCWSRVVKEFEQRNIIQNIDPVNEPIDVNVPGAQRITSVNFRISARSSSHCFVPGCENSEVVTKCTDLFKKTHFKNETYLYFQS